MFEYCPLNLMILDSTLLHGKPDFYALFIDSTIDYGY